MFLGFALVYFISNTTTITSTIIPGTPASANAPRALLGPDQASSDNTQLSCRQSPTEFNANISTNQEDTIMVDNELYSASVQPTEIHVQPDIHKEKNFSPGR